MNSIYKDAQRIKFLSMPNKFNLLNVPNQFNVYSCQINTKIIKLLIQLFFKYTLSINYILKVSNQLNITTKNKSYSLSSMKFYLIFYFFVNCFRELQLNNYPKAKAYLTLNTEYTEIFLIFKYKTIMNRFLCILFLTSQKTLTN